MVMRHLGPQIDIHGGGADLAFPHHTCEIAQSEHYTGKAPFSRFWVHTGMVYQDGEKMSKSLGNLTLVSNLLKDYSADAIRLTLLSHHYRHPWECYAEDLQVATQTIEQLQHVRRLVGRDAAGEDSMLRHQFTAAMDDDLDTPQAVVLLKEAAAKVIAEPNLETGAEILRLTGVLGLCV
jgi:L-cysteine:1D-myo-inositol 2-amino-2-deoxy-alpha-D-glucopyranoside ligase